MHRTLILAVSFGMAAVSLAQSAGKSSVASQPASAPAGLATAAPDEAKIKDIRVLLELTGVRQMAQELIDRTLAQMQKTLTNVPGEFWVGVRQVLSPQDLLDEIVPIYDRHFTHDDIKAMIAFYNSPAGKHLQEVQPDIMHETHEVDQKWSQGMVATILRRADEFRQYQLATQPASAPASAPAASAPTK